jgi:molybdate transport system substrate-binding protein
MTRKIQTEEAMTVLRYMTTIVLACILSMSSARAAEKITIAAAADLKFAMDEIVASFKAIRSGDEVQTIYGSSGKFHTQIQQAAPFDMFFSADVGFAKELRSEGLAATEPKLYAVGRIVLWSAMRDASKLTLQDLNDPAFRKIAIDNPKHAPYGRRAEEALRAVGLWDKIQDRLVFGENIAQTAQFVKAGAVDIGIIALSLAVNQELASKGGHALIPDNLHSPLEQAFVITNKGRDNPLAKAFAQYMESPRARRIMVKYGFVLPGESAM